MSTFVSVQRGLYKDLVSLAQTDLLLSESQLRAKVCKWLSCDVSCLIMGDSSHKQLFIMINTSSFIKVRHFPAGCKYEIKSLGVSLLFMGSELSCFSKANYSSLRSYKQKHG